MKDRQIKYSDFPKIEEVKDIALEILQSGKIVTAQSLAKYLKISDNAARKKLKKIEKNGLCSSKYSMVKDAKGSPQKTRIYYIKDK